MTNVFYPSVVAIPNGIVMMLLLAKVPKKGVFTICAAIQAILFLLVGAFWFIPIGLVIGGVICDFLIMGRNEITMKSMMAAYALFSAIFAFSAICPIKFLQSAFVGAMEKNNIAPEYIQGMLNITSVPMLVVIVAAGLVGGLDNLGHGRTVSDDELGYIAHKEGYKRLAEDVGVYSAAVRKDFGGNLPYYLMGHSMGSFIVKHRVRQMQYTAS